jgi:putative ABC transport system permease protein
MIQNYFTIAWRNLMKNKVFSFINVLGLTMGITICMMIFLYVMNEFSVDRFHKGGDHIYRLARSFKVEGDERQAVWVSPPYGPALVNDYPGQVLEQVRARPDNALVSFGNNAFNERKVYVADSNFFSFFTFPLVKGDPATVLKEPHSVVLTEATAKKYFGDADPMGRVITLDKHLDVKVTGIARDVPANSHMDFDMVIPIANFAHDPGFGVWRFNGWFTYIRLSDQTSKEKLEKDLPRFMDKYMGKDMARGGFSFRLYLTPLRDVYFGHITYDNARHGDKTVVFVFLSIAVLILLIACINFTNLSTIRAVERSKEVGLRKVLGALRNHLFLQFIGESFLLTIISCGLSVILLVLLMPLYNQLLDQTLVVSWQALPIYVFLLGVIVVVGFISGCYPALFLSGFTPIESLKGKLRLGKSGSFFRQALVVCQFGISVLLIIGIVVMMRQLSFIQHKDVGYNKVQTLVVPIDNGGLYDNRISFKNSVAANSAVLSVSMMSGEPGGFFDGMGYHVEGKNDIWQARTEFADFDYVKTLGLKVIAGRDFGQHSDSAASVIINQTAAAELGYTPDQAVGKWLMNTERDTAHRRVIGVVADFNFLSLRDKMDALVIQPGFDNRVVLIRLAPGHFRSAVAAIENAYKAASPGYPFAYSFLDQEFNDLYTTEVRQQRILGVFSGLAIFIACLGLFGLASFTAAKRIKEIGIRKVLGSSVQGIVLLLTGDLLKPILLGTVIAIPLGYYAMSKWLQHFAYRVSIPWWVLVGAACLTLLIALCTIAFKAVNAALANPVKSLRAE